MLEGAGKDLLQALEGVGTGAKQLAGQVIGQAVVMKSDEIEPEPTGANGASTQVGCCDQGDEVFKGYPGGT